MNWTNAFTTRLKIDYPIIQAPMLGVTTPEMVAAVSNEGGLGSLPVGGLSPEDTLALIRKTKSLTTAPFAVNLFVQTFGLLRLTSYHLADTFLDFSSDIFTRAFYLIFVHVMLLN